MRTFLGFGQAAYIGAPSPRAIKLGGISAVTIPLLFQWLSYGAATSKPNVNVLVDIDNAVCRQLDQIRSVYIDNLGSANPVYVFFPDTSYTIVAKPNSEGWYPAYTNSKKIWVIGAGFLTGNIPQTNILLSNISQQAAVNTELDQSAALWLASPVITRGTSIYNTAFGIPALGDQFFSSARLNLASGTTVPLWNTPYPSGFLYITSMIFNTFLMGYNPGFGVCGCLIESTGIAGVLADLTFGSPNGAGYAGAGVNNILTLTGAQIKLDATQTWRVRLGQSTPGGGYGQLLSTFTQQP